MKIKIDDEWETCLEENGDEVNEIVELSVQSVKLIKIKLKLNNIKRLYLKS
jgi:hypothetical protein